MTKYTETKKRRQSFLRAVEQWPQISPSKAMHYRGRVAHWIVAHDEWCPTLRTRKWTDCTCNADPSVHLQSDDPQQVARDIREVFDGAE
jgi:hypothetical protein